MVIGLIFAALLVLVSIIGFMFFAAFGGLTFLASVPKPEIRYGEFAFQLEYEIDGVVKVVEDTIICEFDGFETRGESGKYRKWKSYLKSGDERITILDFRELRETNEFGQTILELFFSYGNAEYYMGDKYGSDPGRGIGKYIEYMYRGADGSIGGSAYPADEAWEKFKIKLISWECDPPIENKFK